MKKGILILVIILISSLLIIDGQTSTTLEGTFLDPSSDTYKVNPYVDPNNLTNVDGYDFLDIVSFSYSIEVNTWEVSMTTDYVGAPLLNSSTSYFMQIAYKPLVGEYQEIQFNFYVRGGVESASLQLFFQNGSQQLIDISATKTVSGNSMVLSATFSQLIGLSLTPLQGSFSISSIASFDLDLNASSDEIQDLAVAYIDGIVGNVQVSPQFQAVFNDNYSDVYQFSPSTNLGNKTDYDGADFLDFIKVGFGYDPANWGIAVNGSFADNIVVNQSISYNFQLSFMINSGNYKEISFHFQFSSNLISFLLDIFASNGTQFTLPATGNYEINGSSIEMKAVFPQLADFTLPTVLTNVDGYVFLRAYSEFRLDLNRQDSDIIADELFIQFFEVNGTVTGTPSLPTSTSTSNNGLPISLFMPIVAIVVLKKKFRI